MRASSDRVTAEMEGEATRVLVEPRASFEAAIARRDDSTTPASERQTRIVRSDADRESSATPADEIASVFRDCARAADDFARGEGFEPVALPDAWLSAEGRGGRFRLNASAWRTRPDDAGRESPVAAELRSVAIHGPNCEILTCLIFPARNDLLPVFATELVAVGGAPRVAFLDLQTPGLRPDRRAPIARRAALAARRFPREARQPAPDWAAEHGSGDYVFSRDSRLELLPFWRAAFVAYLEAWRDERREFAPAQIAGDAARDGRDALATAEALARYKREHVAHSPGTPFLKTVFGADWTERFLQEFLYG